MKAVIGKVLLPGAMVMSKIVEFPRMPVWAVAREKDTLPYEIISAIWGMRH